jgi:hypothetical protein
LYFAFQNYEFLNFSFMKKILLLCIAASLLCSSCGTVFGGRITECQRTKPAPGQPSRAVRPVALVCDILFFWPGLVIDFIDCAIYAPCTTDNPSGVPHHYN